MRILLCGSRGMLGAELWRALEDRGHEVIPTTRRATDGTEALDLLDVEGVRQAVATLRPAWVVNAAAYTAVDRAEEERAACEAVNGAAPGTLAEACARSGVRLLHVSTDFVFSGEKPDPYVEEDPVGPHGVYARSKEAGERAVRAALDEHLIVRVAWLFGPQGKNFVDTILRAARERPALRVVADQRGTPTFAPDAAETIARLVESDVRGTVHASNEGETTWHGLAEAAVRGAGLATPIEAITTAEWPTPAPRPANSALRNAVLERTIGNRMRPWPEALRAHLLAQGLA